MNPFYPLILIGSLLLQQPTSSWPSFFSVTEVKCEKGEYLSRDGRCLHDRTGESHPWGDGCNTATCMDPACRLQTVTAMYCSHGDDPAPLPYVGPPITGGEAVVGSGTITVPFAVATTGDNPFPTMKCKRSMEHTLLVHDGRLYECVWKVKKAKKK